jgi:AraC-like DNA-binding protein
MSHDILSDVLRTVRLRGALFYDVSGGQSWAAEAPPSKEVAASVMPGAEHVMEYHVVIRGCCWAAIIGESPVRLETGDVVVFAHGDAHVISSAPELPAVMMNTAPLDQKIDQLPFALHLDAVETTHCASPQEQNGNTRLVCGFLGCDIRPFNPLIATLPRLLHLRASGSQPWIERFMSEVVSESRDKRPGGEAMLERMSEMMFVDAVRRHVDSLPEDSLGWLGALRDRYVGRALALIHDAPATLWTVDELARRVGLSRSAFHERFAAIIGQSPMQYLANWRMQLGAALLRNTNSPVAWVAQEVGYESEASFGKAFKRLVGSTPGAWRRAMTAR